MAERPPSSYPPPSAADLLDWFPTWSEDRRTLFLGIYHPLIVKMALKFGVRLQDAPDVAQNTIVRLRELADQYDPDRPLFPWVKTVTFFVIREMRREASTKIRSAGSIEIEPARDDPEFDRIWQRELLDQTKKWLIVRANESKMSPVTLAIGKLALFDDRTVEELCAYFKVPAGTIHTAKSRVRKLIADLADGVF